MCSTPSWPARCWWTTPRRCSAGRVFHKFWRATTGPKACWSPRTQGPGRPCTTRWCRRLRPVPSDRLADAIVELAGPAVDRAGASAGPDGGVEVERLFTHLTMQVIERMLFGANRWSGNQLTDAADAIRILGRLVMRELFIPWAWLRRWPGRANTARLKGLRVLDGLLVPRLTDAALLQGLAPDARVDNLRTMFAAGHDTTAQALAWWCALMAHHPRALERAQSELDTVLAGRQPAASDLARLSWLAASLKEALRLYPAVPVLAMRRLRAPVALGRWTLPAGTLLRIAPWMLQRDANAWPQPEQFQPERFMSGAPTPARGAWMPFGAGPRACIGRHLALLEMTVVSAVLLQRCTPQPMPGAAMPAHELNVVLRPRQPLRLALQPRPRAHRP
jgi:cytochrome P450